MRIPKDITGRTFGRLTVISPDLTQTYKYGIKWLCHCSCGGQGYYLTASLMRGQTQSCGCINKEQCRERAKTIITKTHGLTGSRTYMTWAAMKSRCNSDKEEEYKYYKGKGIKVCDRWINSFENFLEDMGVRPHGYTLDRFPNKEGNYEPSNCRWATPTQQVRNRGCNKMVTVLGETLLLAEAVEKYKVVSYELAAQRLIMLKWDDEKAILTPVNLKYGAANRNRKRN